MHPTATINSLPILAATTPEELRVIASDARIKTGPSRELIISPFPGLIYVAEVDPDEEAVHWLAVVAFVAAIICVTALLVFGPKLA